MCLGSLSCLNVACATCLSGQRLQLNNSLCKDSLAAIFKCYSDTAVQPQIKHTAIEPKQATISACVEHSLPDIPNTGAQAQSPQSLSLFWLGEREPSQAGFMFGVKQGIHRFSFELCNSVWKGQI